MNLDKIKSNLKSIKLSYILTRLLTAFVIVSFIRFTISKNSFLDITFYDNFSFLSHLLCIVVLFLLLCIIKSEKVIKSLLLISTTIYFFIASFLGSDSYFAIGLCLIGSIIIYFVDFEKFTLNIKASHMWAIIGVLIIFYILYVGVLCCFHHRVYSTTCYDFGIFSQMFYYMKETGKALVTCERDGLLSHFAVHFSPIYYILLPFYMIFPSPYTLLILQALVVASGIIPIVLLCKKFNLSNTVTVIFSFCYALYPAFMGGCFYYLHENCFLTPLILWLFYFLEKDNTLCAIVFAFLLFLVKEDAPVYVAVIALYYFFAKKNKKVSISIFALSIVWFICLVFIMGTLGEGVMADSRYGEYIYDDGGLFTVIKSVIQNPLFTVKQIFSADKILFIFNIALPLFFLPFAIKNPAKLILLIPFILINLMTNYCYQSRLGYQYEFGTCAILFFLAISNYSELSKNRKTVLLCAMLCSIILFGNTYFNKISVIPHFYNDRERIESFDEAVSLIPNNKSVSSSTFILPHLTERDILYELEITEHKYKTDYVVMDLTHTDTRVSFDDFCNDNYDLIYFKNDTVAVFKKL